MHFICLRKSCQKLISEMRGPNRNEKFICDNCGTQINRGNLGLPKEKYSTGTFHYTQCPNFSTTSQTHSSLFLQYSQVTFALKIYCTLFWQWSVAIDQLTSSESWIFLFCKQQFTIYPSSIFHPSNLPNILCSFNWVFGLCHSDRWEHIFYYFLIMFCKSVGLKFLNGCSFLSRDKSNLLISQRCAQSTLLSLFFWSYRASKHLRKFFYIFDTPDSVAKTSARWLVHRISF